MSRSKIFNNELFSFYKDVISALQSDALALPQDKTIPMFALVGMQSSGKTTILTSLIGFPVGYSAGGTATRCPVRYILQNDETERVTINGRPIDKRNLPSILQQHMDDMAPNFSSNILEVQVQSPSVSDLIVLDLPGLKNEDQIDRKEELDELVARFARSPQYTLICVTPFELVESSAHTRVFEHLMTDPELNHVAAPRLDWRDKSIIVMTKCDAMNTRMRSAVELCEELQLQKSRGDRCIWLCLKPNRAYLQLDQAEEVEKNYDRMCTLLADVKQNERLWVEEYVRSLDPTPSQLEAVSEYMNE